MEVVGYADRLSVAPGETLRFYVSCQQPTYQADIVRLIHGDPNPKGPGFKEELVSTPVSSEYPGRQPGDPHRLTHYRARRAAAASGPTASPCTPGYMPQPRKKAYRAFLPNGRRWRAAMVWCSTRAVSWPRG